jgi:hypothetical protein
MTNDAGRKGASFVEGEASFVREQLAKGRTLRMIAQMMGRSEVDLTKAYRTVIADHGSQTKPPTSRAYDQRGDS